MQSAGPGSFEDCKGFSPPEFVRIKSSRSPVTEPLGPFRRRSPTTRQRPWMWHVSSWLRTPRGSWMGSRSLTASRVTRVAQRFALIAVAGAFAREALSLPGSEDEAGVLPPSASRLGSGTRGGEGPGVTSAIRAGRGGGASGEVDSATSMARAVRQQALTRPHSGSGSFWLPKVVRRQAVVLAPGRAGGDPGRNCRSCGTR